MSAIHIRNNIICGFYDVRLNEEGRYYCRVCKALMTPFFRDLVKASCGEPMLKRLDAQVNKR